MIDLKKIRNKIDQIDRELLALLENRMELALKTKTFKSKIKDIKREEIVINRAQKSKLALLEPTFINSLFSKIIEESKRIQNINMPLIGFNGERGAYSELAARKSVPSGAYIPCSNLDKVLKGLEEGMFDYGVVSIETLFKEKIIKTSDLLAKTSLKIRDEITIPVNHSLIVCKDIKLDDIENVYLHPEILEQCTCFFKQKNLNILTYYDDAGIAKMPMPNKVSTAVIANPLYSDLFGLKILKEHIEDTDTLAIKFLLLVRA